MSLAWSRGAEHAWRVLAVMCVGTPLGCGDDTSSAGDESSSSAGETGGAVTEGEESVTDPTTSASADATSSETLDPDSSGSETSTAGGTEGGGSSGGEQSSSWSSSAQESSGSESGGMLMCPAGTLGPGLPDSIFGNTFGEIDDFTGSCGGSGSPDLGYTFTAPADGFYTFDTHGSQLDTVLYVLDGECVGTELACSDNGDASQSAVSVDLTAGQTVTLIVDGNEPGGLPFTLRVQAGSLVCPIADLGNTVPNTVAGDTTPLFAGTSSSTCGGQAGREAAYLFTAPATGAFTFDTFGSSFASIVYVRNGTCSGTELACGDEGALVDLVVGQQVTVVVDSQFAWGEFDLSVNGLGGACPDSDLGNTVPQVVPGNTNDGDNTDGSSCGGNFSFDDLYEFTAPQDGLYEFNTFGSVLDTVLYLLDGCGGSEIDCNDDFTVANNESRLIEGLDAGQTVIIGVDGNGVGAYQLDVDLVPCPNETLPGTIPQTVNDTTLNGVDTLRPSCGDSGPTDDSPDYAYAFTAPTDGVYTFDTFGTFFDTVLYVIDGASCNGAELGCNDDYQFGSTSALAVTLTAGQGVSVIVDGDFDASGAFTLNIGQLDGTCPDADLGGVIPSVVMDSLSAADNAGFGSCGGLGSNDISYTFTAPLAGLYLLELVGAANDALVYVNDTCGGQESICQIADFMGQARFFQDLAAGQTIVVTVDGNAVADDFTLTIDEAPPGGTCCLAHQEVGCSVQEVEDCVCAMDGFCCMVSWDNLCASEAVNNCAADCG